METDYLASTASAYWRLISRLYAYLKVVCRLQTGEMKLAVAMLIIWTCILRFNPLKKQDFLFHHAGIQSNNAQTCWATSRVFSGPIVARQAVWATRGIDLATGFVFSVGVCSSVEPRVTKRPFFFFSPDVCGIMCLCDGLLCVIRLPVATSGLYSETWLTHRVL